MTTRSVRDADLFNEVKNILGKWHPIPDKKGYRGTGAPGRLLEDLLSIEVNSQDLPDAGRWEIKYIGHNSLVTLFHKDPTPRKPSIVRTLVMNGGWDKENGDRSFRHTIWGSDSERGFKIKTDHEKITVINDKYPNIVPTWDIDTINNSATSKLRYMLGIFGEIKKHDGQRLVFFKVAIKYSNFKFSEFVSGLREGWICIDFDAKINKDKLRNHGTKFRIKSRDLGLIYSTVERIYAL